MSDTPSLQKRLGLDYDRDTWQNILHGLFPDGCVKIFVRPEKLKATRENIKATLQLGKIDLPDGNSLALLEVETTDQVKLARNRVGLRNFVADFIDEAGASAVLAVFHQANSADWRLTYAARQTTLDEDTFELNTIETAPRRFTFLLGESEPCRTAAARLAEILVKGENLTLTDVEKAFSVEKLSKEFFSKYQLHYDPFLAELLSPERAADTRTRFSIPTAESEEEQTKADKPVRDFAKKLLGRLIFLAFLQKKGWLGNMEKGFSTPLLNPGEPISQSSAKGLKTPSPYSWSTGDKNFLSTYFQLAESYKDGANFHSRYLAPLFFEALNTERKDHLFTLPLPGGQTFSSRMPYLNGGLFEPDPAALQSIDFPPQLFADLFSFFSEYNFTIDENDPEDHEIGIDPEMLGHIFENLLEDNKDKGAYYTPKVIVSYMCRQSLLRYLETHLGKHEALTRLCEIHEPGDLREKGNWCAANAKAIATLLEKVKICDPAIGSGAFPIGMLNEIVHLRTLLNSELNDPAERATLKKNIIANCIHGVDLDSGAVDIARLRFWLALVVDEETPSPLPNLDYKIMQGNSLLESFHGVDLSQIHQEKGKRKPASMAALNAALGLSQGEMDIFTTGQLELREAQQRKQDELLEAIRAYFAARKPERKAQLRTTIDAKVIAHIRDHLGDALSVTRGLIDQTEKIIDGTYPAPPRWTPKKGEKDLAAHHAKETDLAAALNKLEETTHLPERPYFLWHLLFRDIFEDGGFDIVIANPPYVRQELIKDQKPLLAAEGYVTATGTADLLVYFYERAATLLKPSGVLTFITSNKYYRAGYGEKLRKYLAEKLTLHTLIDFRDAPVFNGVVAYASILIGQKQKAPEGHEVAALPWDLEKPATSLPLEITKAFPVDQTSLTADGWRLVSPSVQALLAKLRSNGTPLGEYVNGRFYYGIKTGFNEAFVIDAEKRAELIASDPNSEKVIKPFLRGRDLKRWRAHHANLWLLFIPWHFPLHRDASISGASIEAEKAFEKDYPALFRHLKGYKKQLSARNTAETGIRYEWYALQRCAASYWEEFDVPKIVLGRFMNAPLYAFDESNLYISNASSIIAGQERHLCAFLNSSPCWWYLTSTTTDLQNGYLQAHNNNHDPLPIPLATEAEKSRLAELAEACAEATKKEDRASLAVLEGEINQIVYRLFDLTPEEIALIENSLNP